MAKTEVSREPTIIGRFFIWFAMVYFSVVTTTHETSDEAAAAAAVDGPDSIAIRITTDTSTPRQEVAPHNGNLHPVIRIVQEKELGKAVIPIAIAIAGMAIVVAGNDNLSQTGMTLILVLACLGIAAIWSGFLLKETYVKFAQTVEPLGIILVVFSFYAAVAFFLPVWALWVPAVCIGIVLMPFAIAVWQPAPT